jgi:NAD(P)-dependent dehydrogenase (short-subunit alcohol dehydrogenase family)
VTGGASGIGRAACEVLARQGYRLVVADRDELGARAVADALEAFACGVDVSDEASVGALFERAYELLGSLDALVTAAELVDFTPFAEIPVLAFRSIYDVNAIGTYLCIREAARRMTWGGRICTVASATGWRGGPAGSAAYAASKGAVLALTRSAAREFAERGIAVNCVEAGVPARTAAPAEIAEAVAWLLSPAASSVNGATLALDGGMPAG